jgi:hypothetical protein
MDYKIQNCECPAAPAYLCWPLPVAPWCALADSRLTMSQSTIPGRVSPEEVVLLCLQLLISDEGVIAQTIVDMEQPGYELPCPRFNMDYSGMVLEVLSHIRLLVGTMEPEAVAFIRDFVHGLARLSSSLDIIKAIVDLINVDEQTAEEAWQLERDNRHGVEQVHTHMHLLMEHSLCRATYTIM